MSNTLDIVARVRERTETKTNYAVAKALRMQPSNLDRVLRGKRFLGNEAAFRAAKILGLSPADVIALIEEDRAANDAARAYWRSLCPEGVRETIHAAIKAAAATFVTFVIMITYMLSSAPVAKATEEADYGSCNLYILLNRIWGFARRFVGCRQRFGPFRSPTGPRQPARRPAPMIGTLLPGLA